MQNNVLEEIKKRHCLNEREILFIKSSAENLCKKIESKIKEKKIRASVFIGGSLAKKTLIKKDKYDVDVFIRFDRKYKDKEISALAESLIKDRDYERVHGSRDYFKLKEGNILFEIIPITSILKPEEARNVTDLSYFHVDYVLGKIEKNKKLSGEIVLAKSFAMASGCYGAESYINGFSGYALELLVIYYGSFMKFLKSICSAKEKIILDPTKFYRNKSEILENLNEAKLASPIIFVDPTCKSRNAVAALSQKTFERFKERARLFLKKADARLFEKQEINIEDYKKIAKKDKDFVIVRIYTEKQKGDIAGSKMLKFSRFFISRIEKYFEVYKNDFEYNEDIMAKLYLAVKVKKEIVVSGPPLTMEKAVERFKKNHNSVFIKNKKIFAQEKNYKNFKDFFRDFAKKEKKVIKEMGISEISV